MSQAEKFSFQLCPATLPVITRNAHQGVPQTGSSLHPQPLTRPQNTSDESLFIRSTFLLCSVILVMSSEFSQLFSELLWLPCHSSQRKHALGSGTCKCIADVRRSCGDGGGSSCWGALYNFFFNFYLSFFWIWREGVRFQCWPFCHLETGLLSKMWKQQSCFFPFSLIAIFPSYNQPNAACKTTVYGLAIQFPKIQL